MARAATTSDVFNAIGDAYRRDILDTLIAGEKAVGTIVRERNLPDWLAPGLRKLY